MYDIRGEKCGYESQVLDLEGKLSKFYTPDKPFSTIPEEIRYVFLDEASFLKTDYNSNRSVIKAIPAPEKKHSEHKIRAVESINCDWYVKLYENMADTFKRKSFGTALDHILNETDKASKWVESRRVYQKEREFSLEYDIKTGRLRKKYTPISDDQKNPFKVVKYRQNNYQYIIREMICDRLISGYDYQGSRVPPNEDLIAYFYHSLESVNLDKVMDVMLDEAVPF